MPSSADGAGRARAATAILAVLIPVLLIGSILLIPDGAVVGCERDGHFQRAGWLSCGVAYTNAPYGPLLPWLVAPLIPLAGTPYLASRLLSLLALLALVGMTWRAVRSLGGGLGAASLAALLVGLNGPALHYGASACSDLPAAVLFVAGCWTAWRCLERRGSAVLAGVAGLLLAAACLVRVQYYVPAAVLLVTLPLLARRRGSLALWLGFGLPVAAAFALGWQRYGVPGDALDLHLGLAAYTRNLARAGTIIDGGGGEVVPLADRLSWSARLVLRATGGLPLLGAVAAAWLALGRVRWRPLLVVLLPAAALYAGLAWSHPPPDWGARRFYLFLVPLCVVPTVMVGRALLGRWVADPRILCLALGATLVLGAGVHAVWEIRSFRAPQLSSMLSLEPDAPRGLATAYDRQVVREAARLGGELDVCTPVATNFHGVTTAFRSSWFLGDVPREGEHAWAADIPVTAGQQLWLVWVPPGGSELPVIQRVEVPSSPALRDPP